MASGREAKGNRARLIEERTSMTSRQIARLIYLTGSRNAGGYAVVTSRYDGMPWHLHVTSTPVGHALVRALRELAAARPDHFPPGACALGDADRRFARDRATGVPYVDARDRHQVAYRAAL